MDKNKKISSALKNKKHSELAGLDFGTGMLKMVRLKKGKQLLCLEAIGVIPYDFSSKQALELPDSFTPNYAAISCSAERAVSRVVSTVLPGDAETVDEATLRESLNVDASFRVSSRMIARARGKNESSVLGVGIPEEDVRHILHVFESGPPAVCSIEVSFLAALNSYFLLQPEAAQQGGYCFLELGAGSSSFAFVSDGEVMLLGRSNVGGNHIKKRIQTSLGVDEDLAQDLLLDKSVDISAPVQDILGSFLRQLAISRDFMIRRTDAPVAQVILSGGMCASPYMVDAFSELFGIDVALWNPLEHMELLKPLTDEMVAQKYRFAAAIGAAAGGLLDQ